MYINGVDSNITNIRTKHRTIIMSNGHCGIPAGLRGESPLGFGGATSGFLVAWQSALSLFWSVIILYNPHF